MQLIQIGETKAQETTNVTILQMFEQLAQREAEMMRECKARVNAQNRGPRTNA